MSISLLKTLIIVSEQGSFKAAAELVNLSHAAVGQQMRRLEESLQVTLFDRSEKKPKLNNLGKALVPKAREVIHAYESMLNDITGEAELFGELNLGAVPSTIRGLVPLSIKQLMQTYRSLHIRVVPGLSGDLMGQVQRGALDAAILSEPVRVEPNITWTQFAEEPLILLTAPEVLSNDPLQLIQDMPYIGHAHHSAVGMLVKKWLFSNKLSVRSSMEMESLESVTSMVSHNLGVSIVPNICVPDPVFARLRKIPLPGIPHFRELGLLHRTDCTKIRLLEPLLSELQRTVQSEVHV